MKLSLDSLPSTLSALSLTSSALILSGLLSACSKAPQAPLYQIQEESGSILMMSQVGGQAHGEKLWYTKSDSLRVKSEMWYQGSQHGLSVVMDNHNPKCLVYFQFQQGKESGSNQSDQCAERIDESTVSRAFESNEQVMLNYSDQLDEWAILLKTHASKTFSSDVAQDHSFEMGVRASLRYHVLQTLTMGVDRPEWERQLKDFKASSIGPSQYQVRGEFPLNQAPKSLLGQIRQAMAQAGYPSGSQTLGFEWGYLFAQASVQAHFQSALIQKPAWQRANQYQLQVSQALLQSQSLPSKKGEWSGTPGNSYWLSYDEAILSKTHGEGILFYSGIPALSPWSVAGGLFNPTVPQSKDAFIQRYQSFLKVDPSEFQDWIQQQDLVTFQVGDNRLELIPESLAQELNYVYSTIPSES